jgi:hypothetical protein
LSRTTIALVIALGVASSGCDRSPGPAASQQSSSGPRSTPGLVDRARIDACAGFTVEKAAEILGVPPAALSATMRRSDELGGQACRYWSPDSLIGPGVQFLLEAEESPAAAAASLRSLRQNAPAGDATIRNVIGQPKTGPALVEFEAVGDEAMWDALTTGVTLRVGNVVASIQVSRSSRASEKNERDEIELERRVAVEVASGLRAP